MTLGDRIKQRRLELGISQTHLAKTIGIAQSAINKLESGYAKKTKYLKEIAHALQTTPEWLEDGEGNTPGATDLIRIVGKEIIWLPYLDWVSAGEWGLDPTSTIKNALLEPSATFPYVPVPRDICPHAKCYALKVKGNSMANPTLQKPSYLEDEIIIVDPLKKEENKDCVIAVKTDQNGQHYTIFKQYSIESEGPVLKALNPGAVTLFPLTPIDNSVDIVGVVVGKVDYKI